MKIIRKSMVLALSSGFGLALALGCSTLKNTATKNTSQATHEKGAHAAAGNAASAELPPPKLYPEVPQFVVECRADSRPFSISFQSKSGDVQKRDMVVSALFESDEKLIPIAPAWYRAVDATGALQSVCDGLPAYRVEGTDQYLIFFTVDLEPGKSETALVLLDLKTKRVLHKLEKIGTLKWSIAPRYTVIPAETGFQVKLDSGWKRIAIKKGTVSVKSMSSGKRSKAY